MKKFSTLLIILGIILVLTPIIGNTYIKIKQQKMAETYLKELGESEPICELSTPQALDIKENPNYQENNDGKNIQNTVSDVIGKITIPAISSDLLLLEGSDSKHLKYGAGHIIGTALPGEKGNCCIAGHRNYTFGTYFNRIDELKNGDIIEISYNNTVYKYEVFDNFVVLPTEISVLAGTKESSIVTLITCHPKGSNSHRLIIKGSLIQNQ
ncbi:class D sortase [Anaerovorax odorimutans]|uniref:class D sortase n=1 Tax=Anaerovorax odorimutans TaxID=109327 RepID=UPI000424AB62|nr:class D sortase [Anaerovorax odorimutans]